MDPFKEYRGFNFGPERGLLTNPQDWTTITDRTPPVRRGSEQAGSYIRNIRPDTPPPDDVILIGDEGRVKILGWEWDPKDAGPKKANPLDPQGHWKPDYGNLYDSMIDPRIQSLNYQQDSPKNIGPTNTPDEVLMHLRKFLFGESQFENCGKSSKDNFITIIFKIIEQLKASGCLYKFPWLTDELAKAWNGVTIACVSCNGVDKNGIDRTKNIAYNSFKDKKIFICITNFNNATEDQRVATIFHELLHQQGATELDSEVLENACFRGKGATEPLSDDWKEFEGRISSELPTTAQFFEIQKSFSLFKERKIFYVGKWFSYDPSTGDIWLKGTEGGFVGPIFQWGHWSKFLRKN